jgi:hypothetical protein
MEFHNVLFIEAIDSQFLTLLEQNATRKRHCVGQNNKKPSENLQNIHLSYAFYLDSMQFSIDLPNSTVSHPVWITTAIHP